MPTRAKGPNPIHPYATLLLNCPCMTENWKSYFSNVNDKFASIALNLGLRPSVPMSDKPWLLWVWICLQSPNAEGLTTNSEAKVIWGIEKELEKALDAACGGIHCGRITTDGKRELYFYGKTDSGFEAAVGAVMSSIDGYQFDLGTQREPDWNQYLNVLYPSDESMQRVGNLDVLETFEKQGDMLEAEREVQHWIYFRRKIDRDWFVQAAEQRGYCPQLQFWRGALSRSDGLTLSNPFTAKDLMSR